jgi:hypothetical protein
MDVLSTVLVVPPATIERVAVPELTVVANEEYTSIVGTFPGVRVNVTVVAVPALEHSVVFEFENATVMSGIEEIVFSAVATSVADASWAINGVVSPYTSSTTPPLHVVSHVHSKI